VEKRVEYKYDVLGRRVARRLNGGPWRWYFYDGLQVTAEGTGTTDKMYYTHSPSAIGGIISRDNNGTKLWYHYDRLGNVMAITDSNGNMYAGYTMEAFGGLLEVGTSTGYYSSQSDPQPYHLTTKEYDPDTGFYYFNARWYDPGVGRFTSRDPIMAGFLLKKRFSIGTIASLVLARHIAHGGWSNAYAYCANSPVVRVDVSGGCEHAGGQLAEGQRIGALCGALCASSDKGPNCPPEKHNCNERGCNWAWNTCVSCCSDCVDAYLGDMHAGASAGCGTCEEICITGRKKRGLKGWENDGFGKE
jgi:RHS repeat-associated protein